MLDWFLKADKGVGLFARWFTFLSAMTIGFSWLNKNVRWFGELNWPEAILLGIAFALTTLFIGAASLALLRYFKPLPAAPATDLAVLDHKMPTLDQLDDLRRRLDALESEQTERSSADAKLGALVRRKRQLAEEQSAAEEVILRASNTLHAYRSDLEQIAEGRGPTSPWATQAHLGQSLSNAIDVVREAQRMLGDAHPLMTKAPDVHPTHIGDEPVFQAKENTRFLEQHGGNAEELSRVIQHLQQKVLHRAAELKKIENEIHQFAKNDYSE